MPSAATSDRSDSMKSCRASGSSAASGSSRTSRSGRLASAIVSASCAFCPPDSAPTFLPGSIPSRESRAVARWASQRRFRNRPRRSMSATGRFLYSGASCATNAIRSSADSDPAGTPPSTVTRPAVGVVRPVAMFSRVDFPAPFGPTSATTWPPGTPSVQSRNAQVLPARPLSRQTEPDESAGGGTIVGTLRNGGRAASRGLVLGLLNPAGVALILLLFVVAKRSAGGPYLDQNLLRTLVIVLPLTCVVVLAATLTPGLAEGTRGLASLTRRLAGDWGGVPIADPYRPETPARRDPASWRDMLWLSVGSWLGMLLVLLPAALIGIGVIGFLGSRLIGAIPPPAYPGNSTASILVFGVALIAAGLYSAPRTLTAYGRLARSMLAPTGSAELERRVEHLSQTRTETLDSGAAEIRRIERDLHDGAQARL